VKHQPSRPGEGGAAKSVSERLVEVWAEGSEGRGRCGTGWVVGRSGVLTCRHVLDEYLSASSGGAVDSLSGRVQVRLAGHSGSSDWVDATLVWRHPVLDAVLLQVTPQPEQTWLDASGRSPRLAATDHQPIRCTAIGFPDADVKSDGLRESDQAIGTLLVGGGARDRDGLIPFDVDNSVPDDSRLWAGFSGAALVDGNERVIAIVARTPRGRQQRRLLVLPSEAFATDADLSAAASRVGFNAVLADFHAPTWNSAVDSRSLTPAGAPDLVGQIDDFTVFGTHRAAPSASGGADLDYVPREADKNLDRSLAKAARLGGRLVLVVGDSASGKSRTAAEAVRRNTGLAARHLIVPQVQAGLTRLLDANLPLDNHLLWLDDLDKYLSGGLDLDVLDRVFAEHPSVLCVGTIRAGQLDARQGGLEDPAWTFLTDPSRVLEVRLAASLTDDELANVAAISDNVALLNALKDGVGLGEWIVAGPELLKRLANANPPESVLADTIVNWYRTGLQQPLPVDDARHLWEASLPKALANKLSELPAIKQEEFFGKAIEWACTPVLDRDLYEQALVSQTAEGLKAHDYVVDHVSRYSDRGPVPDAIWRHALLILDSTPASDQRWSKFWEVGVAAHAEGAKEHSLTAMVALAAEGFTDASVNVGWLLGELDRSEEAVAVYDEVVARFEEAPEPALLDQVARALVNKGVTLGRLDRSEEAVAVYDEVVARFAKAPEPALLDQVGTALVNKGVTLSELARSEEAVAVFDEVVARFEEAPEPALREQVARALFNKGVTLSELDRSEEAVAVYDEVVARFAKAPEPALREQVATALVNKGVRLGQLDRSEEAVAVYDEVVTQFAKAPEPALREQVAKALVCKGVRLGQLDRSEEAVAVYDEVVTRFAKAPEPALREQVATALVNKGLALGELDRPDEEVAVYDEVVTRFAKAPEPALREQVATALVNKGLTLGGLDRSEEAVAVYDEVVTRFAEAPEPALREQAAKALVSKGLTLSRLDRSEEAIAVYDEVATRFAEAPEPALREQAATALFNKGLTLGGLDRSEEAVAVYDEVVTRFAEAPEPALREQAATALVNKGLTLGGLDRSEEAVAVYDEMVTRFAEAPEPALREQAAKALVNKGLTLSQLDRSEEAIAVYDEVVTRFAEAPEPALREQVATAISMRSEIRGRMD
jgi:tetratricopeptide (TPR) repeat protein